jgi:hypothetical protein
MTTDKQIVVDYKELWSKLEAVIMFGGKGTYSTKELAEMMFFMEFSAAMPRLAKSVGDL